MKKISIVVPVFQNSGTLKETTRRLQKVNSDNFAYLDMEIIFVDDGSSDNSWAVLQEIYEEYPKIIRIIKLSRNYGQVSAIMAGYDYATGDAVVTISADLQDPIDLISQMIINWEGGSEVVIAHRMGRDDGLVANTLSLIAYKIARKSNPKIPQGGFDYLLLSKRAAKIISSFRGRHRFFQGDIMSVGLPTTYLPYFREKRKIGLSGWTLSKKFKYFIDLVLDSSYLPIRLMSALGFFSSMLGVIYSTVIIFSWFRGELPFSGWAPLMIVILIIGGLIMMMLGIIGEYVWRLYDDVKGRPIYIVENDR